MGSILEMSLKQLLQVCVEGENDLSYGEKEVRRWCVYDMRILECGFVHKKLNFSTFTTSFYGVPMM